MSRATLIDDFRVFDKLPRLLMVLLLVSVFAWPQASHKLGNDTEIQGSLQTTRGFNKHSSSQEEGHARYNPFYPA